MFSIIVFDGPGVAAFIFEFPNRYTTRPWDKEAVIELRVSLRFGCFISHICSLQGQRAINQDYTKAGLSLSSLFVRLFKNLLTSGRTLNDKMNGNICMFTKDIFTTNLHYIKNQLYEKTYSIFCRYHFIGSM